MQLAEAQKTVDDWINTVGIRYYGELTNTAILMEETGEVARLMARIYGEQSFKKPSDQSQQGQPEPNRGQPKMSREEAERQLGIAAEAEKETMKNLQKGDRSGCKDGKDW